MRKKVKKLNSRLTDSDNEGPEPGNGFLDGVQHILFLEQLGDKRGCLCSHEGIQRVFWAHCRRGFRWKSSLLPNLFTLTNSSIMGGTSR